MRESRFGSTLVELIVVFAIIGVLAAIVVPTTLHFVDEARVEAAQVEVTSVMNSLQTNLLTLATSAGGGAVEINGAAAAEILNNYCKDASEGMKAELKVEADGKTVTFTVTSPEDVEDTRSFTLPNAFTADAFTVTHNGTQWAVVNA